MNPTPTDTIEQTIAVAVEYHRQGRLQQAEAMYRQVLSVNPHHPDALHMLGTLAGQVGKVEIAIRLIQDAIAIRPDIALYHNNLAECFRLIKQKERTAQSFGEAVRLQPNVAMFWANLSGALLDQRNWDDGIAAAQQAVALDPQFAVGHCNLGAALTELGRLEEAVVALQRAIELKPDYADGYTNLGAALSGQNRCREAVDAYRKAIEINPDFGEAHMNLSAALFKTGDWLGAFREYEWRDRTPRGWEPPQQFPQSRWTGQPLPGKSILLHCEQGFGDTLQMVRYVPLVAQRVGRVILQCQPHLRRLLSRGTGAQQVIAMGDPLPPFDVHCPLMSLPLTLQTTEQTVPARVPYIQVDPSLVQQMASTVAKPAGLKVGITWAGNPKLLLDRFRSSSLKQLSAMGTVPGIHWFSLQKGPAVEQLQGVAASWPMTDLSDRLNDFADTAAVVANLDLVLSVDSAVAHLAGAMAKPVWVLLPHAAEWRWLDQRTDSPWYPTARLFRQPSRGNWEGLAQAVAASLAAKQAGKLL